MLTGILYISDAAYRFDDMLLEDLASQAASKNETIGITGYLYYNQKQFVQYFEGEKATTEELMEVIEKDIRHTVGRKLIDPEVQERRFPGWSMRWVKRTELQLINLEQLLLDQMNRRTQYDQQNWSADTWRIIERLSELHHRMKNAAGPIAYSNLHAAR